MSVKNVFINILISLIAISILCFVAEFITRLFWDSGYRHQYDWSDRTEGYSFEKRPDTFRIVVLGDSNTYGQGVRREEAFPKLVETYLNEGRLSRSGKKIEVINLAWPGINIADEYIDLIKKGFKYDPDIVLVAFCLNDLGELNSIRMYPRRDPLYIRRPLNRENWKWALPIPYSVDRFLTINSDFYLFVLSRYDSLLHKIGIRQSIDHDSNLLLSYSDGNRDWKMTQISLSNIHYICKQRGIRSYLVIIPYFYALENYRFGEIHKKVEDTAKATGFSVLDTLPLFIGKNSNDFIVNKRDTHPNKLAHKMMAQTIFQFLEREIAGAEK